MNKIAVAAAALLLSLPCALPISFYPSVTDKEVKDISDLTARDNRDGRVYWFSNGTAVVNTTTVAIAAGFATIIGLGVASVFHEAATGDFPTAPGNATTDDGAAGGQPGGKRRKGPGTEAEAEAEKAADLDRYFREMEDYEVKYQQYLRDYAAWAEVFGQDPTPPEKRVERRRR